MEDESFLRMNLKMTPKWVWPTSRDPILKFWDNMKHQRLITGIVAITKQKI